MCVSENQVVVRGGVVCVGMGRGVGGVYRPVWCMVYPKEVGGGGVGMVGLVLGSATRVDSRSWSLCVTSEHHIPESPGSGRNGRVDGASIRPAPRGGGGCWYATHVKAWGARGPD